MTRDDEDPGILSQAELHALFGCGPTSEPPIFSQTKKGKDMFEALRDFINTEYLNNHKSYRPSKPQPPENPQKNKDPILNAYS